MWNGSSGKPWGLELEVMDMLYGLPFRDWLELDSKPVAAPAALEPTQDVASDNTSEPNGNTADPNGNTQR
jgi:beta-lactamase class C